MKTLKELVTEYRNSHTWRDHAVLNEIERAYMAGAEQGWHVGRKFRLPDKDGTLPEPQFLTFEEWKGDRSDT